MVGRWRAAVMTGLLVASAACTKYAIDPAPTRPLPQIDPVTYDDVSVTVAYGGSEKYEARVDRVVGLIEKTVRDRVFRCLAGSFDYRKPFWTRADRSGLDACYKNPDNFAEDLSGFRESRCFFMKAGCASGYFDDGGLAQRFTNANVLRAFLLSSFSDSADPAKVSSEIELNLTLHAGFFSGKAIGSTTCSSHGLTQTKTAWFKNAGDAEVAGHWIHEHTHRLGFCDGGDEPDSVSLVSYVYGYIGCVVASRIAPDANDKDYEKTCRCAMLGPGIDKLRDECL